MSKAHVLVVDDEPDIRQLVQEILEDENYEVSVAENAESARHARRTRRPDAILLDIWMPDTDGITLLKEWSEGAAGEQLDIPVIMMSGHGSVEMAVEATRLGAYDFIEKPLSIAKLLLAVRHALEAAGLKQENIGLRSGAQPVAEPVGRSNVMTNLREQAKRIAQHDTAVLVTGESGSGKEVLARYIHRNSSRRSGPFLRVAVAGMADDNASVELFGAEHGETVHFGSLEGTNGGTLFLEDVADMNLDVQARLVSALTRQAFLRVGGVEPVRINVRIVAATSHDLAAAVQNGRFREDLYYQLNVVPLHVPPLREHREDIPELLDYYVNMLVTQENLPTRRFSVAGQNRLRNYDWPGNVRELRNVVQRLLILGSGPEIDPHEIESALGTAPKIPQSEVYGGFELPLKEAREQFERLYLEHQLKQSGGNITKMASRVGMERTHLYRKLRGLGINPKQAAKTE